MPISLFRGGVSFINGKALCGSFMHPARLCGGFQTIFFCLVCGPLEKNKKKTKTVDPSPCNLCAS